MYRWLSFNAILLITINGCSFSPDKEVPIRKKNVTTNTGANFKELVDMYFNTLGYTGSVSQGISYETDFQPAIDWARRSGDNEIGKRLVNTLGYEVMALKNWLKNKSVIEDSLKSLYMFLTTLRVITNALANDEPRRSVLMDDAWQLVSGVQTADPMGIYERSNVFNACKHIMDQGTDCYIFSIKVFIAIPGIMRSCQRLDQSQLNCHEYIETFRTASVTGTSNAYIRALNPFYHEYKQAIDEWWKSDANEQRILDLLLAGNGMPWFNPTKFLDSHEINPH